MTKRMLIDATHPEETRVVVLDGNRLDEFDFETSTKKQLKGNIYLAKVTRVEPSLQAAFVDFGGDRHGFLAFNEIHPDYYQIPVADRQALIEEEEALAEENAQNDQAADHDAEGDDLEEVGGEDEADVEVAEHRRSRPRRQRYKIQEVIKRRQILLVQVVKEERGNKGAALTTYLSLAGRYCVLMPNTTKGGGISRKISNPGDRKRLKGLINDLNVPKGMAVILRTAAVERSKAELKRDCDYLIRAWDKVRELTLKSIAPMLVYEEANLIKRSIRDLYTRDINEIQVEGEEGYKTAKDFMRMLMPSHAKKVQPYKDPSIPLFHRYQVESQLDAMHSPQVQLKSGGYIVIDPTEALVSIDVNSGRATRERNIEETAYKTNLEAAEEIARQLRLRDLAGLIVIDFIDMVENRNQQTVEKRLKEAMRADRARIQIGRISAFGLLELSRQRLRPSLQEASTQACPHCGGTGFVRSIESSALHVLRMVEEEGIRRRSAELHIAVPTEVALYILNQKRDMLIRTEERYGFRVLLERDDSLVPPSYRLERVAEREDAEEEARSEAPAETEAADDNPKRRRRSRRRKDEDADETAEAPAEAEAESEAEADAEAAPPPDETREKPKRRRRGKRGGRRRGRKKQEAAETAADRDRADAESAEAAAAGATPDEAATEEPETADDAAPAGESGAEAPKKPRPRRRSTRGGAKRSRKKAGDAAAEVPGEPVTAASGNGADQEAAAEPDPGADAPPEDTENKVPAADMPATDNNGDADGPKRRGWWNRFTG